jgi:hypothetical protein
MLDALKDEDGKTYYKDFKAAEAAAAEPTLEQRKANRVSLKAAQTAATEALTAATKPTDPVDAENPTEEEKTAAAAYAKLQTDKQNAVNAYEENERKITALESASGTQ